MADVPRSQLPHDPEYWKKLAERIRGDASGPLAAYAAAHDNWYGLLARRSPWLVSASVAAMLILWLALPTSDSAVVARSTAASREFAVRAALGARSSDLCKRSLAESLILSVLGTAGAWCSRFGVF